MVERHKLLIFSLSCLCLLILLSVFLIRQSPDKSLPCPPGTKPVIVTLSGPSGWILNWLNLNKKECVNANNYSLDKLGDFPIGTGCNCPVDDNRVCGVDYLNYRNACRAECAGVQVAYPGMCRIFDAEKELPSSCTPCTIQCQADEVFFEDIAGCPHCECRVEDTQAED
jgi:hypothetical protein